MKRGQDDAFVIDLTQGDDALPLDVLRAGTGRGAPAAASAAAAPPPRRAATVAEVEEAAVVVVDDDTDEEPPARAEGEKQACVSIGEALDDDDDDVRCGSFQVRYEEHDTQTLLDTAPVAEEEEDDPLADVGLSACLPPYSMDQWRSADSERWSSSQVAVAEAASASMPALSTSTSTSTSNNKAPKATAGATKRPRARSAEGPRSVVSIGSQADLSGAIAAALKQADFECVQADLPVPFVHSHLLGVVSREVRGCV